MFSLSELGIISKERTESVLNKGAEKIALLFNPPPVLSLEIIRNSELSGTWFVIPFVPFSYKNKFPITFCLFLIFPNDDI